MSDDAYARAARRESTIWPAFIYPMLYAQEQVADRVMIYGLFANAYYNQQAYIADIETVALANLLDDYNTKIAGLTAEQQSFVIQIAAKRYVAEVEEQILAEKIANKVTNYLKDISIADAKLEALGADEAALNTLAARLVAEEKKTEARIAVLTAEIAEEDVRYALVDADIAEKNLSVLEADLKLLRVAIDIAKIQLQVAEAGIELVNVDLHVAEIENRKVDMEMQGIRAGFTAIDVKVAQADVTIEDKMNDIAETEKTLADSKKSNLETNVIPAYTTIKSDSQIAMDKKLLAQDSINDYEIDKMAFDKYMTLMRNDEKEDAVDIEEIHLDADAEIRNNHATNVEAMVLPKANIESSIAHIAVAAATTLASAKVTTELTHIIGKTS